DVLRKQTFTVLFERDFGRLEGQISLDHLGVVLQYPEFLRLRHVLVFRGIEPAQHVALPDFDPVWDNFEDRGRSAGKERSPSTPDPEILKLALDDRLLGGLGDATRFQTDIEASAADNGIGELFPGWPRLPRQDEGTG